jgi:exodeoxyribonuclease V alpha subunit
VIRSQAVCWLWLDMQGGVKVYRGAAAAARHYVEVDHARVDDYYLAEGTGLAERFVATPDGGVERVSVLDADGYETWVAGRDPLTGEGTRSVAD